MRETVCGGGATLPGFGEGEPGSSEPTSIETIWYGSRYSFGFEVDEPTYIVFQTEDAWLAFWAREPGVAPPTVDFEGRTVLVALYGAAPNSGVSIEVARVAETRGGLYEVTVRVTTAGRTCAVLAVVTYPVHIVAMPEVEGPFELALTRKSESCT